MPASPMPGKASEAILGSFSLHPLQGRRQVWEEGFSTGLGNVRGNSIAPTPPRDGGHYA